MGVRIEANCVLPQKRNHLRSLFWHGFSVYHPPLAFHFFGVVSPPCRVIGRCHPYTRKYAQGAEVGLTIGC